MNHYDPDPLGKLRNASSCFRDTETLSDEARDRIRGSIVAFARENPVSADVEPRAICQPCVASPWYRSLSKVTVKPALAASAAAEEEE